MPRDIEHIGAISKFIGILLIIAGFMVDWRAGGFTFFGCLLVRYLNLFQIEVHRENS